MVTYKLLYWSFFLLEGAWFEYWIDVKKKNVRPNTVRNYTERYYKNIRGTHCGTRYN